MAHLFHLKLKLKQYVQYNIIMFRAFGTLCYVVL